MSRVWISVAHQDALVREATRTAPNETGGVLLGYRGEGGALVVAAVVGPGPAAVHAPARFVPDHAHHEREIARLYEASGRMYGYLGDWHSHPYGTCVLSPRDRATLRQIGRAREARVGEPVMLVVCGGAVTWDIAAHRLIRGRVWRRIERIAIETFS